MSPVSWCKRCHQAQLAEDQQRLHGHSASGWKFVGFYSLVGKSRAHQVHYNTSISWRPDGRKQLMDVDKWDWGNSASISSSKSRSRFTIFKFWYICFARNDAVGIASAFEFAWLLEPGRETSVCTGLHPIRRYLPPVPPSLLPECSANPQPLRSGKSCRSLQQKCPQVNLFGNYTGIAS